MSFFGARAAMDIKRLPLEATPESTGLAYQDVSFTSRYDQVLLKGWFFPGYKEPVIVLVHGGYQNRVDESVGTLGMTRDLVSNGYNVLLFDLRGRGESEGRGIALSFIDEDIGGAVDFLVNMGYSRDDVCVMGFCSGAVKSCIYASRNDIGAVILDGCFIDVPTMVVRQASSVGIPGFLTWVFIPGIRMMAGVVYDYELINPIDVVSDVNCPILFIHEEHDEYTTSEETLKLYRASNNAENEIWEVSDSEHTQAYFNHPVEYIEKVTGFLERVM
jgi:dipeptidyl aminopeptidase/acylaminoacyl peptidase